MFFVVAKQPDGTVFTKTACATEQDARDIAMEIIDCSMFVTPEVRIFEWDAGKPFRGVSDWHPSP
jgi:hypothetical protein